MINLITGVPGAGKTYFSVNIIYRELISKDSKYKKIYTNINLDFEKCNKIKKDFVFQLNLDNFLSEIDKDFELSNLFKSNALFKEDGSLVSDYDSYISEIGLFKDYEDSLIILDECHLYFTSSVSDKLLRFLSYHRHFKIDMDLVTQNKSLINRKYLAFIENMYIGQNPSKRLFSKVFVYKLYASYKEYSSNYVGKEKLKFDKKIASLYNSGSNKINKSFSSRLLIPFFILAVIAILFFIAFKNYVSCGSVFGCSHTSKSVKNYNLNKSSVSARPTRDVKVNSNSYSDTTDYDDLSSYNFYYKVVCFKYKCIVNNNYIISRNFLNFFKKRSKVLTDEIVYPYETIYLLTNFDLSKFQGGLNEMDTNGSNYNLFGR